MPSYVPPPDPRGELTVKRKSLTQAEVYFIPDDDRFTTDIGASRKKKLRLLLVDSEDKTITIEPRVAFPESEKFGEPKYAQIRFIRIAMLRSWNSGADLPETREDVLELLSEFPPSFIKDPDYGLGLAKDYRFIINAVEKLSGCNVLEITKKGPTRIDCPNGIFYISEPDFEGLRKTINGIAKLGQLAVSSVKTATTYNRLAEKVGGSTVAVTAGRSPIRRMITAKANGDEVLALPAY